MQTNYFFLIMKYRCDQMMLFYHCNLSKNKIIIVRYYKFLNRLNQKKKNEMKTSTHFDGMADNPTLISKLTIFLYIYFISIWHSFFFSFAHKYSKQTQKLGNRALIENENEKRPIHTCIWLFLAQPFHFFCISFSFCPVFCI